MLNSPKKFYPPVPSETERIGKLVLDAAYKVHTLLGPGLLESVYQVAMKHVLETSGVLTETEVKLPILFKGVNLESALRIDVLVEKCIIAELKSVEKMNPVYGTLLSLCVLRVLCGKKAFILYSGVIHGKSSSI
jgi:GxxExxY protein